MFLEIYRFVIQKENGDFLAWLTMEAICDTFSSLIWDVEYYECGQFEVCVAANPETVDLFQRGRIVGRSDDTQNYGIIEKVHLETDVEDGNYLTVTGRLLMSILSRRMIYPTISITSEMSYGEIVQLAVQKNCIKSIVSSEQRIIPALEVGDIKGTCWNQKATLQVSYENLMDWIYTICETVGGTANIRLVPYSSDLSDTRRRMIFELSQGTDRSILQNENPAVVFSDDYDNLPNYIYDADSSKYTNFAYVFGQGTGTERKQAVYFPEQTEPELLQRFELYVDADDISIEYTNEDGNAVQMTNSEYEELLIERGKEKLTAPVILSEATIASDDKQHVYRQDYQVGDDITLQNNYFGLLIDRIQLIGMIESFDENGYSLTPIMKKLEG